MTKAYLFIGHGTRQAHGVEEFLRFVATVQESIPHPKPLSGYAFLELQDPDIASGIGRLVSQGATEIVGIPLLLFTAGHMKVDIPSELNRACARYPDVPVSLSTTFGHHSTFRKVARVRMDEASADVAGAGFGILLLGRGNQDASAQMAFDDIAADIQSTLNGRVQVGFLAGSGTPLEIALDRLVSAGYTSIVVSPYLWFRGWLTDTLPDRVQAWQMHHPDTDIFIGHHLGVHPALIEVVRQRVMES